MKSKKELFEEVAEKQLRTAKKVILIVFGCMGILFLILALALWIADVRDAEAGVMPSVIFASMGAFFLLLGGILYFALPVKMNYEKYERRFEKYGTMSYYDMAAELMLQREQIRELEEKIAKLEARDSHTS